MGDKVNIIHKDCDPSLAKSKSLPRNAYIVSYSNDDKVAYDIVQGTQVTIFDHYYDEFRNVISINWTEGNVNPKIYNSQPPKKDKK